MTDQPEWLKDYVAGMTNPEKWYVLIDGEGVAVIARPGGTYWNGSHQQYAQSMQWLITKGVNYWDDHQRTRWSGRVTREKRQLMVDMLAARDGP